MSLIRYPGSKAKLADEIIRFIPDEMLGFCWADGSEWEYREPFFGSGAIGFRLLGSIPSTCRVWLNDKDHWLACLWKSVRECPNELQSKIASYNPSSECFYLWKAQDGDKTVDPCEAGFRKLAIHQTSYSGLGVMAGGPLGGKDQENAKYPVDCRWRPDRLCLDVRNLSKKLNCFQSFRFSNSDFDPLLSNTTHKTFIYLDPPYVLKGPELYKHSLCEGDHERLAKRLRGLNCAWVLSYDDCDLVRQLYSWAKIHEVRITYTTATARDGSRPKNKEVVITP